MKFRLTDVCFVVGAGLILGPLYIDFFRKISFFVAYTCFLLGGVLTSIASYDALAQMIGNGNPGEDLLQSGYQKLKKFIKKLI